MKKDKEINIVIAMKSEAMPLINFWKLKENKQKIFNNEKKKLI